MQLMLLCCLTDIVIGHWGIWQYQWSNVELIGWPSIEGHNDTKGQIW